ncbi:hypothetical protein AKJ56_00370 [candidate division MSBL1 archaeon SCGC-AAA382N08]|uniref:Uncharacterized protein n=1 Tax=candidate division MSBL1 archaeon SCGC-AAA382N08 TaxID=1698285 RepID=A0A133VQM9_9EURY|nr:hypothetical protein AKJ56_00370 [candidate division MSBL1 archaeon SCGC-AAA382N08]
MSEVEEIDKKVYEECEDFFGHKLPFNAITLASKAGRRKERQRVIEMLEEEIRKLNGLYENLPDGHKQKAEIDSNMVTLRDLKQKLKGEN